jgi:succinate dehydrogenase / fumarate reductase cytochrome b subunit
MTDGRDALMIARRSDGSLVRRPISPFMLGSADKPQITSVLSIMHRITGCALAVGTLLLTWWLVAAATSPASYAHAAGFIGSPIGILMLFGWTAALFYHLLNGVRHLAWDAGFGFELPQVHATGWAVVIGTAILTVLTWLVGIVLL